MILRTLLLTTLGLSLAAPALADIYRWTDDHGQVHFGQNPPHGVDAERVDGASQPPPPASDAEDEAEADDTETAEEEPADDGSGTDDAAMEEMCDNARQNAEVYADESVRRIQEDGGETQVITPEEREERLEEAQEFLDEYC